MSANHARIAAFLGLGPDASADDIVREIAELTRRAETAESDADNEVEAAKSKAYGMGYAAARADLADRFEAYAQKQPVGQAFASGPLAGASIYNVAIWASRFIWREGASDDSSSPQVQAVVDESAS